MAKKVDHSKNVLDSFFSNGTEDNESPVMPVAEELDVRASYMRAQEAKPESHTKRVQMLMKPSVHAAIKAKADAAGLSINAYMNTVLEDHLK